MSARKPEQVAAESTFVDEKNLRRRIMAAIRSYGYSSQDKADIESRADGVMIVPGEYVLPFVQRRTERVAARNADASREMEALPLGWKRSNSHDFFPADLRGFGGECGVTC